MSETLADAFKLLTRATRAELVWMAELQFPAFHPQGLVRLDKDRFVLSTVEVLEPLCRLDRPPAPGRPDRTTGKGKGWIIQFDRWGRELKKVRVDNRGSIYHPGGIDFDGDRIWCPVAEYRPNSSSFVCTLDPETLEVRTEFEVPDHIGAVARDVPGDRIYGASWGSRRLYEWTRHGAMRSTTLNPSHWIDYQELRFVRDAHGVSMLLCSGIAELPATWNRIYELGGFALVDPRTGRPYHECPFPVFTPRRHVATRNAVYAELDGDVLWLYMVADDDGDAALLAYCICVG